MAIRRIKAFFEFEAAGGIVLALAAIAAMIIANSPLNVWYEGFIHAPVSIQIGEFAIAKDAHHWINDGLMAVFFFLVGLELKREVLIGELSNVKQIILPAGAALGGGRCVFLGVIGRERLCALGGQGCGQNVGGGVQVVLRVTADQFLVFGKGHVALDDARAHASRRLIGLFGVLREHHGRATVTDRETGFGKRPVAATLQLGFERAIAHVFYQKERPRPQLGLGHDGRALR